MARVVFADTGFFVALFDPNDNARAQAVDLMHGLRSDDNVVLLSTRDVLNEILAHFSRSLPRTRQLIGRFVLGMLLDPKYRIVSVTREQYLAALRLYIARPDKRYSMVDCISMTVMRDEGTYEVLATDRDFTQEGFVNVLKGSPR